MKISISKSHPENWGDTIPDKKGRFYKVYFKTSFRLSGFSEEDLLHTFDGKIINC
ncbi:hypothetical protein [Chryseobacterium paridis]|uniref:Uncharacterized protein n=1 Tax=Chryseobacterium paridis TaxID=2800328 RepID=A0ABS1FXG6_9FLAO|nr:hypothetical protein [Chryseobacterium paridis]MBK1897114.1 hypothetical protein [Chryseobacterium paridis]